MKRDHYLEHYEIGKVIGIELDKRVHTLFENYKNAAARWSELTELSATTTERTVRDYCDGGLAVRISPAKPTRPRIETLQQLAVFYEVLGLEEDDLIVQKTREINPSFQYPLDRNIHAQSIVQVTLSEGYKLTSEQLNHLENLARMYVSQNLRQ